MVVRRRRFESVGGSGEGTTSSGTSASEMVVMMETSSENGNGDEFMQK